MVWSILGLKYSGFYQNPNYLILCPSGRGKSCSPRISTSVSYVALRTPQLIFAPSISHLLCAAHPRSGLHLPVASSSSHAPGSCICPGLQPRFNSSPSPSCLCSCSAKPPPAPAESLLLPLTNMDPSLCLACGSPPNPIAPSPGHWPGCPYHSSPHFQSACCKIEAPSSIVPQEWPVKVIVGLEELSPKPYPWWRLDHTTSHWEKQKLLGLYKKMMLRRKVVPAPIQLSPAGWHHLGLGLEVLQVPTAYAPAGFPKQPRSVHFSPVSKNIMRDVLFPYCQPLCAVWFWILNYFGQKEKASLWEVCRVEKPGRAAWCPASKRGLNLLLCSEWSAAKQLCSSPIAPHQAFFLQEYRIGQSRPLPHPLLLILAPQEHGEGETGGLPRGQGDGSRGRSSQAVPRVSQGHYIGMTSGDQLSVQSAFVSRGWMESDSRLKFRL